MDFTVFDTKKMDEYAKRAKEQWGQLDAYKEFEDKAKDWTDNQRVNVTNDFMKLFEEFGAMKEMEPSAQQVQNQVEKLQAFITDHFYHCTNEILRELGKMYTDGGEFTQNIDRAGGAGTADLVAKAIDVYCA